MKKVSFIGLLIFLLSACQTEVYYTRSVVNDTEHDIDLIFLNTKKGTEPDTIRLDAQSTTVIEDFHELDPGKSGLSCAPERDRIELKVAGFEAILREDFFDEDNWEKYLYGSRSMDQDCIFQIDEENLLLYNPG